MLAARQEGFLKKFNLTTTSATSNMHLFDKEGVIKKYATPEQILEEFFDLRLEYYEKRKEIMLKNLELELLKLESKVKFIRGFLSGEIRIFNRKKADIAQDLRQRGFTPVPKKATVSGTSDAAEESEDESESDYDYLGKLTMEMFSVEKTEELCAEIDKTKEQLEYLKKAIQDPSGSET
ncbi:unnamed protein product [Arabidopsis lyrata]|uniref:DNA topoisomerase (ATP-hydrolyzing) n=1 Tax=Arabidopsis lyrata subsp. lyrata TaxID=81972 RepID=D7L733_ARALL|nr:hypothetical protein ARALYDRAFT_896968 [Arabidopsis lyrata subsp. lyrata]CAH8259763.1 unnamed protein product [Arabidopsis lyrata]